MKMEALFMIARDPGSGKMWQTVGIVVVQNR